MSDHSDHVSRDQSLTDALSRLSLRQREVIVLRYYGQMSEQETAEILGIPVGTVKSRTSAAMNILAATLDRDDFLDRGAP